MEHNQQPRELETNTPTYNELLNDISRVEGEVEAQDYMLYSPTKEQQVMDEVLDARLDFAPTAQPKAQQPKAGGAHTPVDDSFKNVNREAARSVFSHPADDAVLARETNGKIPLPDYAAQGLNDFPVPPPDALRDSAYDPHNHTGTAGSKAGHPLDAYPSGSSAPFYEAPEEDGPSTPTLAQQAGMGNYDASPDDLDG